MNQPLKTFCALLLTAGFIPTLHAKEAAFSLKDLKKMEGRVQAAVKRAIPATVSVFPQGFAGTGSAVIVSADGYVLTAAHVIASSDKADIIFPDGERLEAEVLSRNPERDIALMKITSEGPFPYVEIGDSKALKVTDILIALGHPGGYDIRRSAPIRIGRVYVPGGRGFIATDCTLVGGDSGGPLIDLDGKVVGIHSSIGGSLNANNHAPVHAATDHWDDMKAGKDIGRPRLARRDTHPDQPVLGVVLERRAGDGVPVTEVRAGSPAAAAEIQAGDVIVGFNEVDIEAYDDFFPLLNKQKPGEEVNLTVLRDGKEIDLRVTLGRRGDIYGDGSPRRPQVPAAQPAFLGVYFEEGSDEPVVEETIPGSAAAKAGLRPGDRILHANGTKIDTIDDIRAVLKDAKAGDALALKLQRKGKQLELDATLGPRPPSVR